jgi:alanine racemase
VAELRRRFGRDLTCVVKGDAYGLGLATVVTALSRRSERAFAVGTFREAAQVAQLVDDPSIVVMGPELGLDADGLGQDPQAVMIVGRHTLDDLRHRPPVRMLRVQIEVDCGVGRGGVPVDDLIDVSAWVADRPDISIAMLAAHFPPDIPDARRIAILDSLVRAEESLCACVSIGGSDVLRWADQAPAHWPVRVGRSLYGIAPRWLTEHGLVPAWAWTCDAFGLARSPTTGYRARQGLAANAVHLGVGFADGLPPQAGGRWPILVDGHLYVIDEVFMLSSIAVQVDKEIAVGDRRQALLSGQMDDDAMQIRTIAEKLGLPTTAVLMVPRAFRYRVVESTK